MPGYSIKQTPEDFIVEEVSETPLLASGPYTIIEVKKEGLNTEDAVRMLTHAFHLENRDISYAGLKDKRALTTQRISLKGVPPTAIERFIHPQLKLRFLGFSNREVYVGSHTHNRFTINVSLDLLSARVAFDRGKKRIENNPQLINYFDEQRFSKNNVTIGIALLKKDFKKACDLIEESGGEAADTIKQARAKNAQDVVGAIRSVSRELVLLYVHAVQSAVYNNTLHAHIHQHGLREVTDVSYSQGTLAFCDNTAFLESLEVPLIGFGRAPNQTFDGTISTELARLGITERDFIIRQLPGISCEGSSRLALVPITDIRIEEKSETKVRCAFTLPKGSYATMVIKQLFLE
jgi:tRNA pseudouridine13 synthase